MTYQATAVKVMIASPSDVPKERLLAKSVIYRWNDINAEDKQVVLMPIGWETHTSPEMGDRPQAIINKQILNDCDLLVAMFWTRIGSPTGKSVSGTVEEIQEHFAAGKLTMIYFSATPVEPDSIDAAQYDELKKFRGWCRDNGLYETYDSLSEFEEKLFRHLSLTVIRKFSDNGTIVGFPSPAEVAPLSSEAKELLLEASQDRTGTILRVETLDGLSIETNGRSFTDGADARMEAKWDSALESLAREDYVKDRGTKGEVFQVTNEGYEAASSLQAFRQTS